MLIHAAGVAFGSSRNCPGLPLFCNIMISTIGVMINEEPDITDGRNNRDPMFDEESEEGIAGANQMVSTTLTSPSTTSPSQPELLDCVIRLKSVFKCKMCPRIVCLSEETMKTHLKSKVMDLCFCMIVSELMSIRSRNCAVQLFLFLFYFKLCPRVAFLSEENENTP